MSIITSANSVEVIAHRGSSGVTPENTLSSIHQAITEKSDYIEIDVQMTKDNQVIVIHDKTIDRTTNSKGAVKDFTLEQLKSYDAGSWFDKKFKNQKIPSLLEVLDILDQQQKLIIEVKNNFNEYPGIEKNIVNIVKLSQTKAKIIYKSFSKDVLDRFKSLDSKREILYCTIGPLPVIPFYIDYSLRIGSPLDYEADYYQVHKLFLSEKFIKLAHAKNKKIIGWDIHQSQDIGNAISKGVDIIETDFPTRVLSNFFN